MLNSNRSLMVLSPLRPRLNNILVAIAGLGFIGLADSAYLTLDHYIALPLPCTITHGCETVLTSAYAMVGPVPLAVFGIIFYLALSFLALYILTSSEIKRSFVNALFGLITIGFGMSVIFESIQAFLIHAYCQYCALSALDTLILLILGMWFVRVWSKRNLN